MTKKILLFAVVLGFFVASCDKTSTETGNETETAATETETNEESANDAAAVNGTFNVDAAKSMVNWVGKKVAGQHNGSLSVQSGTLNVTNGALTGGEITIDMNSLKVLDLEEGSDENGKLTGHLQSEDFFNVAGHPTATFTVKSATAMDADANGNNTTITGDLTIKGITNEISFPAKVEVKAKGVKANAKVEIDRTAYDIKYGSGKFFENLGDNMINDNFELELKIVTQMPEGA